MALQSERRWGEREEETYTFTRSELEAMGIVLPGDDPDPEPVDGPLLTMDRAEEDAYQAALAARENRPARSMPQHPQQDQIVAALIQQNQMMMAQMQDLAVQVSRITGQLNHGGSPVPQPARRIRRAGEMSQEERERVEYSGHGLLG